MRKEPPSKNDVKAEEERTRTALALAGLFEDGTGDDVVFPMPPGAVIASIVASYDAKGSGRKVRCAACVQHQKHYRGFRVALEDGRQVRLGIDCGENHFGKDAWGSVRADFNRRVELATFQSRVAPALRTIELAEPLIGEWHSRTNRLARWLGAFKRELPDLWGAVATAARRTGGRFQVERLVKREIVNAQGQRHTRREPETQLLGRLPFPAMFLNTTPTHGLNGAGRELADAVRILGEKFDAVSLAQAFRSIQRARQHLQEADAAHLGAISNLDGVWLTPMCEWANQLEGLTGEYRVEGRRLVHQTGPIETELAILSPEELGPSNLSQVLAAFDGAA